MVALWYPQCGQVLFIARTLVMFTRVSKLWQLGQAKYFSPQDSHWRIMPSAVQGIERTIHSSVTRRKLVPPHFWHIISSDDITAAPSFCSLYVKPL